MDQRAFAKLIGRILRIGVSMAATVALVGMVLLLVGDDGSTPDYALFRGESPDLRTVTGIVNDAAQGSPRGLIQLGVLILIATPIIRVACSIVGFARDRDWVYVFITVWVFALLGYSVMVS
jgi:uncharacterized membrane protein